MHFVKEIVRFCIKNSLNFVLEARSLFNNIITGSGNGLSPPGDNTFTGKYSIPVQWNIYGTRSHCLYSKITPLIFQMPVRFVAFGCRHNVFSSFYIALPSYRASKENHSKHSYIYQSFANCRNLGIYSFHSHCTDLAIPGEILSNRLLRYNLILGPISVAKYSFNSRNVTNVAAMCLYNLYSISTRGDSDWT